MAALIISQKRHALDGLLSPQSKSILHRQSRVQQPSRAQIADSHHQTKPESLTNWSLQGVPRDSFATDPVPSNCAHGARDRAAQAGPIIRRCARLILLIAANLAIFFVWTCPSAERARDSSRFTGRLVSREPGIAAPQGIALISIAPTGSSQRYGRCVSWREIGILTDAGVGANVWVSHWTALPIAPKGAGTV